MESSSVVARGWEKGRLTVKEFQETFWGEGCVVYLESNGSHTTVHICQHALNCMTITGDLNICKFNSINLSLKKKKLSSLQRTSPAPFYLNDVLTHHNSLSRDFIST